MSAIIDCIHTLPDLYMHQGASKEQIKQAECQLGTTFNSEFREYLSTFGCISYGTHELTGICASPRLNVVHVTQEAFKINPEVPRTYYVIEESGIDGMLIWQSPAGEIYMSFPGRTPNKIAGNLLSYLRDTITA